MSTTGSSYEIYDDAHSNYDKTRLAVGNAQLLEMLGDVDLSTLRVLDAGCGTGVHLEAFHAIGMQSLVGLDYSVTGLAQSAVKFAHEHRPAPTLVCADIRTMPFADASFDLILFSFVLHHLPHQTQAELEVMTRSILSAVKRLLTPQGRLALITCTPEQLSPEQGCMWYYSYFPAAARNLQSRFLSVHTIQQILQECGYCDLECAVVEQTYWTELSLDPEGPFRDEWRSGDSLFALCAAHPERFKKDLERLRADILSGVAGAHIQQVYERAEVIKQATILLATKPSRHHAGRTSRMRVS